MKYWILSFFLAFTGWVPPISFGQAPALVQESKMEGATRIRDVIYGYKSGMALTMDVLKPTHPNGIGVVYLLSGGWRSDHSMIEKRLRHFKYFTDRGQTVFLIIHGSVPKFLVNEVIQDVHRAVRFVRYHAADYGVDPNRLGVSGMSSGGHLSLSIGTGLGRPSVSTTSNDPVDQVSSQVQAVACFFPPTDLVNFGSPELLFVEQEHLKRYRPAFAVDAKTREEKRKVMQELSPIYAVSKQMPPILLLHGTQDTIVPLEQSQRFIARVKEQGVPAQLIIHQGGEHGWAETWENDLNLLADWFEKYLLGTKK